MKRNVTLTLLFLLAALLCIALAACGNNQNIPTEDDFVQVLNDLGYSDEILDVSDTDSGLVKARGLLLYGDDPEHVMPLYAMYIRYTDQSLAEAAEEKLKTGAADSEYVKINRSKNVVFAIIANGDGVETAKTIWSKIK